MLIPKTCDHRASYTTRLTARATELYELIISKPFSVSLLPESNSVVRIEKTD